MSIDDDYYLYEMDAAMAQMEEDILQRASSDNTKHYLGTYGDAISERINKCRADASALFESGFYSASLLSSVTGIELTIKYLLVLPLIQGALLPNPIADVVGTKIGFGRSTEDRKMLPTLLQPFGIDLDKAVLPSGKRLWNTIQKDVLEARNRSVHLGEDCAKETAAIAMDCLRALENEIVFKLADKLGFSLSRTGCWSRIDWSDPKDPTKSSGGTYFTPGTPFTKPEKKGAS
jgi:hypothetical protein